MARTTAFGQQVEVVIPSGTDGRETLSEALDNIVSIANYVNFVNA
jgi:hypothetical protein